MVSRNLRFRFTLVSYNILSQTLMNDHNYLYTNCNPKDLEWPKRGHKIVSELLDNQADIICLQEVESDHLQSLYKPKLARYGYECLYKKKTGYKIDGCAIFYKSKLFQLMTHKGIEFNRTNITNLLNRDNVGIIAVLRPKIGTRSKSSHLVIANTHLIFNPKRSDIRLAQLKYFLSELEELSLESYDSSSNQRHHHATILCGDLNSEPDSDISKFILGNTINDNSRPSGGSAKQVEVPDHSSTDSVEAPTGTDQVPSSDQDHRQQQEQRQEIRPNNIGSNGVETGPSDKPRGSPSNQDQFSITCDDSLNAFAHSLQFKSVYPVRNGSGQRYVSTFSSCVVDYIFYTPKRLILESYRELLTERQLDQNKPLPNAQFPSDHISLEAKFTLK